MSSQPTHEDSPERSAGVGSVGSVGIISLPSGPNFGKIWSLSLPPKWSTLRGLLLSSSSFRHLSLNAALILARSSAPNLLNSRLGNGILRSSCNVLSTSWTVIPTPRVALDASMVIICGYPWWLSSFSDSMGGYTAGAFISSFGRP